MSMPHTCKCGTCDHEMGGPLVFNPNAPLLSDEKPDPVKCAVRGCRNFSDGGTFHGEICSACFDMLVSGEVHKSSHTFIGGLYREALERRNSINPQGKPVPEEDD